MVVYSCKCLNVQVFGQDPPQPFESDSLDSCPLGAKGKVVELIDPGFNFTHKCLVHRERNDPWTVYICVPCHMRTHVVNVRANLLVVNSDMEVGEEAILAMRNRPEYLKVFKLVLAGQDGRQREEDTVKRQSHETLQRQLGELQTVVCSYLKSQEEVIERRVRKFEAEQRAQLDKLTEHVKEEKTKLVSILFQNSERTGSPVEADQPAAKPHAPLSHSRSSTEYNRPAQQNLNNHANREMSTHKLRDSSPDVFALEELELEDEENTGGLTIRSEHPHEPGQSERGNSPEQVSRPRSTHIGMSEEPITEAEEADLMSTSVPISVPGAHFRNLRRNTYQVDDLEDYAAAEFDDIPRHMQQLSESIQERDRYIFGDRPRQRVHTGDFTQVKWK